MGKKSLLTGCACLLFLTTLTEAQFVRLAPPPPPVERRVPAPDARHVWVAGYQRWDGRAYIWTPGRWVLPPRAHAFWVPGRWDRRPGGYAWVPGHWQG